MASTQPVTARFRSATEFPKSIQPLEREAANALYAEMRDCLIFTNRSRAQLIRRNQEHKTKTGLLKADVERLQQMITQLTTEKQRISREKQGLITELEAEMKVMSSHLDELSVAFQDVADVEDPDQSKWSFMMVPGRFFHFLRAVKAIVLWWRTEHSEIQPSLPPSPSEAHNPKDDPQMFTDPASVNRSLLDK